MWNMDKKNIWVPESMVDFPLRQSEMEDSALITASKVVSVLIATSQTADFAKFMQ
jgi:hypothetical protein